MARPLLRIALVCRGFSGRQNLRAMLQPQSAIAAITGSSVRPRAVSLYSVRGGTTANSLRAMRPQACSSFSSFDRMRSLIGGHARRSSEEAIKRDAGFADVSLFFAAFTWRGWVAYS